MKPMKPITSCVAVLAYQPDISELIADFGSLTSRAWARPSNFWPQRSVIRVKFLNGSKGQQAEARKRFEIVDALVNLTFQFVTTGSSEIRVRFDKGKGHWSYLGKQCLNISQSQATMNLDLQAGAFGDMREEWNRVAVHECLHAIGLEHEHQSPLSTGLVWNKEAVYAYYGRTQGWTRQMIDFQVLNRYSGGSYRATKFDPTSIMEYPIPAGLANITVGWNDKLSKSDIDFLKSVYP